jgi:hypothetical protein
LVLVARPVRRKPRSVRHAVVVEQVSSFKDR